MLIRDAAVGVGADERVAIVVLMGGGRYMRDGACSYWTFVVMGGLDIGRMMVIEVPIYERTWASSLPETNPHSISQIVIGFVTYP